MSHDYSPVPKTGSSEVKVTRPEKPDMEMLVKEAMGAYYHQETQPSASFPSNGFGDPSLFKVVAKTLEPPKWAFLGTAALAAAPGGLVVLLCSYIPWKAIPIPHLSLYAEGLPYVVLVGMVMFVAIRSRGGSIISYAMGALAGGILIASIFAAQIIRQNTSQPGAAPAEGQKQHAGVVVSSMEGQRIALSR